MMVGMVDRGLRKRRPMEELSGREGKREEIKSWRILVDHNPVSEIHGEVVVANFSLSKASAGE